MINSLAQRDPKWKDILLGFNTDPRYTIGGYGCVITCIAMQAGLTPDEVNRRLKSVNGFDAGSGNIIWTKIKQAIPWLDFINYGYSYNNDVVKDAIAKYGSCIVRVDFDSNTATPADHHYVLFTGNQKMNDPWTGTERPTTAYSILQAYVIINVGKPPETSLSASLSPSQSPSPSPSASGSSSHSEVPPSIPPAPSIPTPSPVLPPPEPSQPVPSLPQKPNLNIFQLIAELIEKLLKLLGL